MRAPHLLPLLLIAAASSPALAGPTCKYVDQEGRITFANVPIKNARKVMCFEAVPEPAPAPRQGVAAPSRKPGQDTAASLRVDPDTQRRRDQDRRRILEDELSEERRLLAEATAAVQAALAGGANSAASQEQSKAMREAAARHERNIEAIQRELTTVR